MISDCKAVGVQLTWICTSYLVGANLNNHVGLEDLEVGVTIWHALSLWIPSLLCLIPPILPRNFPTSECNPVEPPFYTQKIIINILFTFITMQKGTQPT